MIVFLYIIMIEIDDSKCIFLYILIDGIPIHKAFIVFLDFTFLDGNGGNRVPRICDNAIRCVGGIKLQFLIALRQLMHCRRILHIDTVCDMDNPARQRPAFIRF